MNKEQAGRLHHNEDVMWRRSWTLLYCCRCRWTRRHSVSVAGLVCEECAKVEYITHNPVLQASVIDGDSVSIRIYIGDGLAQEKPADFRLYGVDAPELHGANHAAGIKVRDMVSAWIVARAPGLMAVMYWTRRDKYGRPMMDLYERDTPGSTLSSYLVGNKLARAYKGDAKAAWTQDELEWILRF